MKRSLYSIISVFFLIVINAWFGIKSNTWGENRVIQNDVISYYAYLPATFIFKDLSFDFVKDLPENFEGKVWLETAPNGKPILRMTMGLAILWIPFFFCAHVAAQFLGVSTLGYSWPYSLSIFVASLFYLFVGLLYLRKNLLRFFSDKTTAITLILIVLATNLMYYVITEPGMSHVFSFCLINAFLFYSFKWIERSTFKFSAIVGLLAGMIVLIRPVNIVVLLFPAFLEISSFSGFVNRIASKWKWILLAMLFAFLVMVPQLLYWKSQTGHFLFNSYMDQGKFFFNKPQIINGLFSYRKGWLIYTPVMFFSLFGFLWLKKYASGLLLPILIVVLIDIYVVYSWWCWWYGGSFSSRPMVDIYGIMAIPLAAFIERGWRSKILVKGFITIIMFGFITLNQFQIWQYQTSLLHWDSMTREVYWKIMFKKQWPENYEKMLKIPDYEKALKGEKEYP